jgi:phosphohistidine phosphatase
MIGTRQPSQPVQALYLLRHAKSSWDDPTLADHQRPLAARGRRDAKRIAKHLRGLAVQPELVLCSPATRTQETLDLLRPAVAASTVMLEEGLYAASSEELLARIRLVPDSVSSVMLIGHNPGLHELAVTLASAGDQLERLEAKFPTAALATLSLAKTWGQLAPGDATLEAFVVPKQLR